MGAVVFAKKSSTVGLLTNSPSKRAQSPVSEYQYDSSSCGFRKLAPNSGFKRIYDNSPRFNALNLETKNALLGILLRKETRELGEVMDHVYGDANPAAAEEYSHSNRPQTQFHDIAAKNIVSPMPWDKTESTDHMKAFVVGLFVKSLVHEDRCYDKVVLDYKEFAAWVKDEGAQYAQQILNEISQDVFDKSVKFDAKNNMVDIQISTAHVEVLSARTIDL